MRTYLLRRLLLFVPTLLGVSLTIFILLRVMPGDVAGAILSGSGNATFTKDDVDRLREKLGLNRPLPVQYGDWLWDTLRGDLGRSAVQNREIGTLLKQQFPVTVELTVLSMIVVAVISIPIGIIAAVKQDGWLDYILRGFAVLGLATPAFFVGLLVILLLSRVFHWTPPLGFVHLWVSPGKSMQQLIFPSLALGFALSGLLVRLMRAQLLEVLREDFIRTARAKGLSDNIVVRRHAVRNALLPVITIFGAQIGALFTGAVVIEIIFNLPGIGRGLIEAMTSRDLPLIQTYIIYFALITLVANLIVDLTYGWLDPRIRYE